MSPKQQVTARRRDPAGAPFLILSHGQPLRDPQGRALQFPCAVLAAMEACERLGCRGPWGVCSAEVFLRDFRHRAEGLAYLEKNFTKKA
ncbi:MAG: hypothetical protein M0P73_16305 [Syntrophobacterales bacterium]|jgi:hypothetical protein|nr:hypothetical protein [Syntrophobacterales bacterium]